MHWSKEATCFLLLAFKPCICIFKGIVHCFIQFFKSPIIRLKPSILFSNPKARITTLVTPIIFFLTFYHIFHVKNQKMSVYELKQYDMQKSFFLPHNYDIYIFFIVEDGGKERKTCKQKLNPPIMNFTPPISLCPSNIWKIKYCPPIINSTKFWMTPRFDGGDETMIVLP